MNNSKETRFGYISFIEDVEFIEALGVINPSISEPMGSYIRSIQRIDDWGMDFDPVEKESLKNIAKVMDSCIKSEICWEDDNPQINRMTKKGWDMLREAINKFLSLPSIQADLEEMEKDPEWARASRRQSVIDLKKSEGQVIQEELKYWEK